MKAEKISVKWKIMVYMLIFVAVTLLLLWLFQIVFLDSFYRGIKTKEVKDTADEIVRDLKDDVLQETMQEMAMKENIFIRVIDERGKEIYSVNHIYPFAVPVLKIEDIESMMQEVRDSGGDLLKVMEVSDHYRQLFQRYRAPQQYQEKLVSSEQKKPYKRKVWNMMYARTIETENQGTLLILINTLITPIGATAHILKIELFYIIGILFVVSAALAYVMYRNISRPIMQIEKKARLLAFGDFSKSIVEGGYREITQLNDTLNYAAEELAKTENLRRELLANVSHDLRTPLTMITGYGEIMRDIPGENTPENIQIIIDEAIRMKNLVNDILDVSKLQSGKTILNCQSFNITKSIEQMLSNYRKLLKKEGYQVLFEKEKDILVIADEVKISQVIYNLMNNAVQHTGINKKVVIRQIVQEQKVKIEVIDFGWGIEESEKKYIWDRYYKSSHSQKKQVLGTGLGLSIVKSILELHEVEFGVESKKGEGSNFWFYLPTDS